MMKRILCALAAMAVGFGLSPAYAVTVYPTVTITLDGTLTGGVDSGGIFGPVGASLAGDNFQAVASYDLATMTRILPGYAVSNYTSNIYGTLSINGSPPVAEQYVGGEIYEQVGFGKFDINVTLIGPDWTIHANIDDKLSDLFVSGNNITGPITSLQHPFSPQYNTGAFCLNQNNIQCVYGDKTILSSFSETNYLAVLSVPEPGTWALMFLGLGGIGVALRRSRRYVFGANLTAS